MITNLLSSEHIEKIKKLTAREFHDSLSFKSSSSDEGAILLLLDNTPLVSIRGRPDDGDNGEILKKLFEVIFRYCKTIRIETACGCSQVVNGVSYDDQEFRKNLGFRDKPLTIVKEFADSIPYRKFIFKGDYDNQGLRLFKEEIF